MSLPNNLGFLGLAKDYANTDRGEQAIKADDELKPISFHDLLTQYPALREPVIEGLLRKGETMNVIADPKAGKSWLALDMALSIATGRAWLGTFPVEQGRCLIIDNELHPETIANRLPKVAEARNILLHEFSRMLDIIPLRGRLRPLDKLADLFGSITPGQYSLIILDAWYRFMSNGADENGNNDQAQMYNLVDQYSRTTGASFVLIHHATKGGQGEKKITDVGAGGGAQSRAADTHLVIREHEEKKMFVIDAAIRSSAPMDPFCLRWDYPVFTPDQEMDPGRLKKQGRSAPQDPTKRQSEDIQAVVDACRRLCSERTKQGRGDIWPVSTELRANFGKSKDRFPEALKQAVALGHLELVPVRRKGGQGSMRDFDGYRVPSINGKN